MTLKPVFYYLAAPDGSCFVYPAEQLPCKLEMGFSPCIDHRLYEIERIIPNLTEAADEPAEQWVLVMLKRLRGVVMPKFLNMGPKESLLLSNNKAVLVLLKDVDTGLRVRRVSLSAEARLSPAPEDLGPPPDVDWSTEKEKI